MASSAAVRALAQCSEEPRAGVDRARRVARERRDLQDQDGFMTRVVGDLYAAGKAKMRDRCFSAAAHIFDQCAALLAERGANAACYRHLKLYQSQCAAHKALSAPAARGEAADAEVLAAAKLIRRALPHLPLRLLDEYACAMGRHGMDTHSAMCAYRPPVLAAKLVFECGIKDGHATVLARRYGAAPPPPPGPCQLLLAVLERAVAPHATKAASAAAGAALAAAATTARDATHVNEAADE